MKIKVGDFVFFKSDVEQWAEVVEIKKERDWLGVLREDYTVKAPIDGFRGDYIRALKLYDVDSDKIFDVSSQKKN